MFLIMRFMRRRSPCRRRAPPRGRAPSRASCRSGSRRCRRRWSRRCRRCARSRARRSPPDTAARAARPLPGSRCSGTPASTRHRAADRIDRLDAMHALERQADLVRAGDAAAHQSGEAAHRHDRLARGVAGGQHARHLVRARRAARSRAPGRGCGRPSRPRGGGRRRRSARSPHRRCLGSVCSRSMSHSLLLRWRLLPASRSSARLAATDSNACTSVATCCGGRRRRHQHHVVERCDQAAAVQQRQVDRLLEGRRVRGLGLGAVAQRPGRADELDARADAHHVPRQPRTGRSPPAGPAARRCRQRVHVRVRRRRHDVLERRAHRGQRQRVGRQRGAHAGVTGRGLRRARRRGAAPRRR